MIPAVLRAAAPLVRQAATAAVPLAEAATSAGRAAAGAVAPIAGNAARTAGRAAASPLRAALPPMPQSVKNFAKDVAEEAIGDAILNTTGIKAQTAPSAGGTTYQLAKTAVAYHSLSVQPARSGSMQPASMAQGLVNPRAGTGAQHPVITGAPSQASANADLYPASMQGWLKA